MKLDDLETTIASKLGQDIPSKQKTTAKLSREDFINGVVDYLVAQGIPEKKTYAIVGNLLYESSGNPQAVNPKSGAYGIAQWLGPRKAKLKELYGDNPTLEQQLEFLMGELQGDYSKTLKQILGAKSIEHGVRAFHDSFEKSDKPAYLERTKLAKESQDIRRGRKLSEALYDIEKQIAQKISQAEQSAQQTQQAQAPDVSWRQRLGQMADVLSTMHDTGEATSNDAGYNLPDILKDKMPAYVPTGDVGKRVEDYEAARAVPEAQFVNVPIAAKLPATQIDKNIAARGLVESQSVSEKPESQSVAGGIIPDGDIIPEQKPAQALGAKRQVAPAVDFKAPLDAMSDITDIMHGTDVSDEMSKLPPQSKFAKGNYTPVLAEAAKQRMIEEIKDWSIRPELTAKYNIHPVWLRLKNFAETIPIEPPKPPVPWYVQVKNLPSDIISGISSGMYRTSSLLVAGTNNLLRDLVQNVFKVQLREGYNDVLPGASILANWLDKASKKVLPTYRHFGIDLAAGLGSSIAFWVPGLGTAGYLQYIRGFAPWAAKMFGVSIPTVLESIVEGEDARQRALQENQGEEAAALAAWKTALINLPLIALTDRLGIFGEYGRLARRVIASGGMNGVQELLQSVTQDLTTGNPINWKESAYEFAVGAGVGAIFAGMTHRHQRQEVVRLDNMIDQLFGNADAKRLKNVIEEGFRRNVGLFADRVPDIYEHIRRNPIILTYMLARSPEVAKAMQEIADAHSNYIAKGFSDKVQEEYIKPTEQILKQKAKELAKAEPPSTEELPQSPLQESKPELPTIEQSTEKEPLVEQPTREAPTATEQPTTIAGTEEIPKRRRPKRRPELPTLGQATATEPLGAQSAKEEFPQRRRPKRRPAPPMIGQATAIEPLVEQPAKEEFPQRRRPKRRPALPTLGQATTQEPLGAQSTKEELPKKRRQQRKPAPSAIEQPTDKKPLGAKSAKEELPKKRRQQRKPAAAANEQATTQEPLGAQSTKEELPKKRRQQRKPAPSAIEQPTDKKPLGKQPAKEESPQRRRSKRKLAPAAIGQPPIEEFPSKPSPTKEPPSEPPTGREQHEYYQSDYYNKYSDAILKALPKNPQLLTTLLYHELLPNEVEHSETAVKKPENIDLSMFSEKDKEFISNAINEIHSKKPSDDIVKLIQNVIDKYGEKFSKALHADKLNIINASLSLKKVFESVFQSKERASQVASKFYKTLKEQKAELTHSGTGRDEILHAEEDELGSDRLGDYVPEDGLKEDVAAYGSESQAQKSQEEIVRALKRRYGKMPAGVKNWQRIVAKHYSEKGVINLQNFQLTPGSESEIIADLFYVYRSPKSEKLHAIIVNKDNQIVRHDLVAIGNLNNISPHEITKLANLLKEYFEKNQDDKVFILHNHPSGDPTMSSSDIALAEFFKNNLGKNFGGFVVIDHTHYSYIAANGKIKKKKYLLEDIKPRSWIIQRPRIQNVNDAVTVAKDMHIEQKQFAALFLNSKNQINGWLPLNNDFLIYNIDQIDKKISTFLNNFNAARTIFYIPDAIAYKKFMADILWRNKTVSHWLLDVIGPDHQSSLNALSSLPYVDDIQHVADKNTAWDKIISFAKKHLKHYIPNPEQTISVLQNYLGIPQHLMLRLGWYSLKETERARLQNSIEQRIIYLFKYIPTLDDETARRIAENPKLFRTFVKHPAYYEYLNITDMRLSLMESLKTKWYAMVEKFVNLPPGRTRDIVWKYILIADKIGSSTISHKRKLKALDALDKVISSKHGTQVYEAYKAWRDTADDIWQEYQKTMQSMGLENDLITKARWEMGFVPGYFPHRRIGKYHIVAAVYDENNQQTTLWRSAVKHWWQVEKELEHVKKKFKNKEDVQVFVEQVASLSNEIYDDTVPIVSAYIAKEAIKEITGDEITPDIDYVINDVIKKLYKGKGFARHVLERRNIPGFQTTALDEIAMQYVSGAAGFLAKFVTTPAYLRLLATIDPKKQQELFKSLKNHIASSLENQTALDVALNKASAMLFFYYIALRPAAALVNLTGNHTSFAPYMSYFTKHADAKLAKWELIAAREMKEFKKLSLGKQPHYKYLTPEMAKAVEEAFKSHMLSDQLTAMLFPVGQSRKTELIKRAARQIYNIVRFPFSITEQFNRFASFLMAFDVFTREHKLSPEVATEMALEAIGYTHGNYIRANMPVAFKRGVFGKLASGTAYKYKFYTHNQLALMRYLGDVDKKALLKLWRNLFLLGGLPFSSLIMYLYKLLTGDEREMLPLYKTSPYIYKFVTMGIPGMFPYIGINLSRSVDLDIININKLFSLETMVGPYASIAADIGRAIRYMQMRDYYRALESISPFFGTQMARHAMMSYRLATRGMATPENTRIYDMQGKTIKMKSSEAWLKGLTGFHPASWSIRQQYGQIMNRLAEQQRNLTLTYARRYLAAKTPEGRKQVLRDVAALNEKRRSYGLPPIDIKRSVKSGLKGKPETPRRFMPFTRNVPGMQGEH